MSIRNKIGAMGVIALLSALLNAFLLGLIAAHLGMPHPHGGPPHFGGPDMFARLEQAALTLPDADRARVQKIIDDRKTAIETDMHAMDDDMPAMDRLLTAPTLDRQKLAAQNVAMARSDDAMRTDMFGMMAAIAVALPDAERQDFFRQIAPRHDMGHPMDHDRADDRDRGPHGDPDFGPGDPP